MKQIRNSVFETNSSSMHSVTIRKDDPMVDYLAPSADNYVHTQFGKFGWGPDTFRDAGTKLSYLVTLIARLIDIDINDPELNYSSEELHEMLECSYSFLKVENLIKSKFNCNGIWIDESIGYIDHQSYECYSCMQDFLDDWGIVSAEDFIFDTNIVLHIDNDNH